MFQDNPISLRKLHVFSQDELAEKVVAMLVVKSLFASYRRNSASYDAFY